MVQTHYLFKKKPKGGGEKNKSSRKPCFLKGITGCLAWEALEDDLLVDGDALSTVTMKASRITVFRAFCKGRDSSWSPCSQWDKEKIWLLMDAWTTRLERCLTGACFPRALQNLSQGQALLISGREKKIPMFSGETMIWPLTQRLLQLSPLLPLHRFFSVGKHFAGEVQFLLLCPPTHPEWPHAADLQLTCLATPSNWQLNMAGYNGSQQRWILQKTAQKAEVMRSSLPKFWPLSFSFLCKSFPFLLMLLWYSFFSLVSLQSFLQW